jgi:hypothetical protein
MNRLFKHLPSPTGALAVIALVIALGSTAVAASRLVGGDKLIKVGSLSGNRLRSHTLTGAQINLNRLGQVPAAAFADNATHAGTADTAAGLAPLNWVPLTLINGWTDNYGAGDARAPAVAVDAQGIVHLRGQISSGTSSSDMLAMMPAQFRPSQNVSIPAVLKFASFGFVEIHSDGQMWVLPSSGNAGNEFAYTSLDGLTYALG